MTPKLLRTQERFRKKQKTLFTNKQNKYYQSSNRPSPSSIFTSWVIFFTRSSSHVTPNPRGSLCHLFRRWRRERWRGVWTWVRLGRSPWRTPSPAGGGGPGRYRRWRSGGETSRRRSRRPRTSSGFRGTRSGEIRHFRSGARLSRGRPWISRTRPRFAPLDDRLGFLLRRGARASERGKPIDYPYFECFDETC